MQKILVATDAWYPQVNGVVTTIDKLRINVPGIVFLTPDSFNTWRLPGYPQISLSRVKKKFIEAFLERHSDHYIHISTEGPIGLAVRKWCVKNKKNFTTTYHTKFPEFLKAKLGLPLWSTYWFFKWFHSKSSAVMVSTDSLKTELELHGFKNIVKWSRGVDTDLFYEKPKHHLYEKETRFLYVGRVSEEKNIEAFLQCKLPGIKVVVGDGPQLNYLKQKYPEVKFMGELRFEDLANAYRNCDVFVFPSKADTFGLVIIEALACGKPVAAYPVTGPIDILNDKCGVMSDNLEEACINALALKSEDCIKRAKDFNWKNVCQQFVDNLVF